MKEVILEAVQRGLLAAFDPEDFHLSHLLRAVALLRCGVLQPATRELRRVPVWRSREVALIRQLVPQEVLLNAFVEEHFHRFPWADERSTFLWGVLLGEKMVEVYDYYVQVDEFVTRVVGLRYEGRWQYAECLKPGDPLLLLREKHNPYDANAISVRTSSGVPLGYVRRTLAAILAPAIDGGEQFACQVEFLFRQARDEDERLFMRMRRICRAEHTENQAEN